MKDEERCILRVNHAADRGDAPPTRKRRCRHLQERVRVKAEYFAGNRYLGSYWRALNTLCTNSSEFNVTSFHFHSSLFAQKLQNHTAKSSNKRAGLI